MGRNGIGALSPDALALVAARFRTLADPLRLRILQALEHEERNVGDLTASLRASQPNVSKQLKALREAGFVQRRTEGTSAYWSVSDPAVFALCDAVCRGLQARASSQARLLGSPAGPRRRR
ncbi:MAG TPA: metalloregulator ArsR/SmtB family transcription factor [Thermoanaerobaculia bacterium]|nr:metalloregulator ArsR/SmtB family transcription factor [Thermoanaerobaculia bacterium]